MSNKTMNDLAADTTVEWYTPPWLIAKVKELYGGIIDLDPASCETANRLIGAQQYYTEADSGLAKRWYGNVWVNHPYGRDTNEDWIEYISMQSFLCNQIVGTCFNSPDTDWGKMLFKRADAICFIDNRVAFYNPKLGRYKKGTQKGSIVYYFGSHVDRFYDVFNGYLDSVGRTMYSGQVMVKYKMI